MRTIVILVLLVILTSFNLGKKVSHIYIKDELHNAKFIKTIIVYNYSDSTMLYGIINSNDTLNIKSKRGRFLNLKESIKIKKEFDVSEELAGKWPDIGQNVLMVVDTTNAVRLFGLRKNNEYRFWDPNSIPYANSIFIFPKEKPFKPLPICLQYLDTKNEYWNCSDGCLIDADAIELKN